jgi:transposase
MKNKNCNKISILADKKFIPIDIKIYKGNIHDSKILQEQMSTIIDKYKNIKYLIADKGYCSKITREKLITNNIKPIIDYNNRNTKTKAKNSLTNEELKIYKKRIYIKHIF